MAKRSSGPRPARAGKNTNSTERMQIGLRRTFLSRSALFISLCFVAALIIVLGLITFYYKVYADPQRVFWDTMANNLATSGVTKQSISKNRSSGSTEIVQIEFAPTLIVRDVKTADNPTSKTKVALETVGTPSADYQHYSLIQQKDAQGHTKDFSRLYGMWLKNAGNDGQPPKLVNSVVFGGALFGDLSADQRSKVLDLIKQSYQVDFKNIDSQTSSHRRTYTYTVSLPLKKYASAAHQYAVYEKLPLASQIKPSNYSEGDKLGLKITIDVLSRQVKSIEYLQQNLTEQYSGYGIQPDIKVPTNIVSAQQFQQALQSVR